MLRKISALFSFLLLIAGVAGAQVTTSSMHGVVKGANNEPLVGATIVAVHTPTGSKYTTTTRTGGQYSLNNMNTGGPYTVTVSYVGMSPITKSDIYLNLGESFNLDLGLAASNATLTEVVVSATRAATGAKGGSENVINRERIQNLPTVGRNLTDYLRTTPQFKLTSGAYGDGGFSIAGQNNRYNSFYIDGAVNNDVFGLAASGTNGGQSSISPISIDALDQFQVLVSPYDATLGNFTGGAINATTKSGTNDVHGSAYYIFRNQNLAGKTPDGDKKLATRLTDFDNKTYGFTVGGPIIKNKLFYFVNGEMQRDQTPYPFDLTTYSGNTKDVNVLNSLSSFIKTKGYDPGNFLGNLGKVTADRIAAKVDWNIDTKNKLTLSYRYNAGEKLNVTRSSGTAIYFQNSGYLFPDRTNSASAELKSNIGNNSSNRLLATFTSVVDDRGPTGAPFPYVRINDGNGQIYFGTEPSSIFNYLNQKSYNILDHFKFNRGKHSFTAGFEGEYFKSSNAFIQNTLGYYIYDSIGAFTRDLKPNEYRSGLNLIDTKDDKTTDAAAKFDVAREAFFISDDIRASQNLTLTLGLRADLYQFVTTPRADQFAIDSALPKFAQYYDLRGAMPGKKPNIPVAFSPRLGFNYKIPDENVVVRGGIGLFTGRVPLVWPGGIYNNTGITTGGYTLNSSTNTAIWNQNLVRFRTTGAYTAQEVGLSLANAKGALNLISADFKLPKVLKTSLAVDKKVGNGWTTTIEAMLTKNINDVYYQNVNLLPPTLAMNGGGDTRKVYPASNTIPIRASGVNPYSGVYLLENAEGVDKGYAYNFSATINKTTRTGFTFYATYNYGDSYVLNEAQSSTNTSQWNSMETVNGRNFVTRSRSDNSVGHRIFGFVNKRFTYAHGMAATTIGLTYTGQSGQPFSFVSSGSLVRDGQTFYDLIYIPTAAQLQSMTFLSNTIGTTTYTPDQQKAALEAYIQRNSYLNAHRGQYAERNGSRLPWSDLVDLKIQQDFNLKLGGKTYAVQAIYNMFNFTNFVNRKWGRQYFAGFDQVTLLTFANYVTATANTTPTPQYRFNPQLLQPGTLSTSAVPSYSSRWIGQLEFRIRF